MLRLGEVTALKSVYTNLGDNEQPRIDTDERSLKTNRAITTQSRAEQGSDTHAQAEKGRLQSSLFWLNTDIIICLNKAAVPSRPFE